MATFETSSGAKPSLDFVEPDAIKGHHGKTAEYEAMFNDLRYFGWMAYGIISILSYGYYSEKFYRMDVMRKTSMPTEYHTFWGFGEYMRVFVNMAVSGLQGIAWVGTFAPVAYLHEIFGDSTTIALTLHGLKYLGLILTKVGSFATDNFKRDYEEGIEDGMFDAKMFNEEHHEGSSVLDTFMEMGMLGGQLVAWAALHWTSSDVLKRVKEAEEEGVIEKGKIVFDSAEPKEWYGIWGPESIEI